MTPRVLKDGSDSVGVLGALNRVHLNIGLFSEEWLLHFNPFVGAKRISPIPIKAADRNSIYWQATEQQTYYMAQFLLAAGRRDPLAAAPGGQAYHTTDATVLDRGKTVFAERCARCHSSNPSARCRMSLVCRYRSISAAAPAAAANRPGRRRSFPQNRRYRSG
jgi:hypothetical protein